MLLSNTGKRNV